MTKGKMLVVLLIFLLAVATAVVLSTQFVGQTHASEFLHECDLQCCSVLVDDCQRGGHTLSDIRQMLQQEDAFAFIRGLNEDGTVTTYYFSLDEAGEVFGFLNDSYNNSYDVQPLSNFNYNRRQVFPLNQVRDCVNSVVLVLLGDGFMAGNGNNQAGHWPNPANGTFLRRAINFANTITNFYPFSLFRDVFKVYAIETPSTVNGINIGTATNNPHAGTYLGTYVNTTIALGGGFRMSSRGQTRSLNISNWASSNAIMTQVIANSDRWGGIALGAGAGQENNNSIGITSRGIGEHLVSGVMAYQRVIIHEIGHNFGRLTDEHATGTTNLRRANIARASDTDDQLKWGQWIGHNGITRRTLNAPAGYIFPSTNGTCMMQNQNNASFCAVCREELVRRMAMQTGRMELGNGARVRALTFRINSRTGWLLGQRTYSVTIFNNNSFSVQITYNHRMAYGGGARDLLGLNHLINTSISANGSITVDIQENVGATHITAGIRFVTGPTAFMMVSYANGLTPTSSNPPNFNVINRGVGFRISNIGATAARIIGTTFGGTAIGEINIPRRINGRYVTELGTENFAITNVTRIHMLEGITTIGHSAFLGFGGNEITLPTTITSIGSNALNISANIRLVAGITHIRDSLFASTGLRNISIPSSVTYIGNRAFAGTNITSVTLPFGVATIGYRAFSGTPITGIQIPSSLTSVGDYAFSGSGLRNFHIPLSLTHIGRNAFINTMSLESITVAPNHSVFSSVDGILYGRNISVFYHIPNALSGDITIPHGITTIPPNAFANRNGITTLSIPSSVTAIGTNAFYSARGLHTVTLLRSSAGNDFTGTALVNINAFLGITLANLTIYVPCWDSVAAYRTATNWITLVTRGATITTNAPPPPPPPDEGFWLWVFDMELYTTYHWAYVGTSIQLKIQIVRESGWTEYVWIYLNAGENKVVYLSCWCCLPFFYIEFDGSYIGVTVHRGSWMFSSYYARVYRWVESPVPQPEPIEWEFYDAICCCHIKWYSCCWRFWFSSHQEQIRISIYFWGERQDIIVPWDFSGTLEFPNYDWSFAFNLSLIFCGWHFDLTIQSICCCNWYGLEISVYVAG